MNAFLRIESLHTGFATPGGDVRVLRGLSLEIAAGETVGIVGETGAGKTVLALSIMRLLRAPGYIAGGRVLLEGRDLLAMPEQEMEQVRGRKMAMIFQHPRESLNPVLSVEAHLRLVLARHAGVRGRAARARARDLLGQVELPDPDRILRAAPHQLSGGMCQRVMIALCLACAPQLLIADEATTALDVTVQLQILRLLRRLRDEFGLTLIVITHNLGVIAEVCERVAVLYAGELVEDAPVGEVFRSPRHPYTARLLACRPTGTRTGDLPSIPGTVPNLLQMPPGCLFHPRCHRVQERCRHDHPAVDDVGVAHRVRCFFPEESVAWTPSSR